jgi:hydroxyacylglutathione hydrolase
MKIEKIVNYPMDVNTYVVINDDNKCLVIDPSFDDKKIMKMINQNGLEVEAIVLTHAHFDHLISANTIALMHEVPIYVHKKEVEFLYDGTKNLSITFTRTNSITIDNGVSVQTLSEETKQIGSFSLNIYHVPGHSPGSVAIHFKDAGFLISGDCLFNRSVGRTDLFGGDEAQLIKSIKTKLLKLKPETIVYPGHGPHTTIGYEKDNNPYLRGC